MFFVAGITGKIGGATARRLLNDGHAVRALVRDRARAGDWVQLGVELLEGDLADAAALGAALAGVDGAFLMQPTPMGVPSGFPEATALNASIKDALRRSPPPRLVALSSVGSEQTSGLGNITQTHLLEQALGDLRFPLAIVRAGALIENYLASLEPATDTGVLSSFLQPVDRAFPMIATQDVGAEIARLLTAEPWVGRRIIEVGSPITPIEIAVAMGECFGREVVAQPIPREHWGAALAAMGLPNDKAENLAEMQDGFNSGWIHFGVFGTESVAGTTSPARVFERAYVTHLPFSGIKKEVQP